MAKKTLIIGLDGATFDLIFPWIEQGKLPHLSKLMKNGVYGELESVPNMISPAAWSSFMTGKNPGKHGIYFFLERVPNSYSSRLVNASDREGKTIWELLSEEGHSVGVMNVPMSYPVKKVNGFWISGFDAPGINSTGAIHPSQLIKELEQNGCTYIISAGIDSDVKAGRMDLVLKKIHDQIDMRAEAAFYLFDNHPCEHFTFVFTATDTVQHHFWQYIPEHSFPPPYPDKFANAIYSVYERMDDIVGRFLSKVDDDTVTVIMSDHGGGFAQHGPEYINPLFERLGLLRYIGDKAGAHRLKRLSSRLLGRLLAFGGKIVNRKVKEKLVRFFPKTVDRLISRLTFSDIDWSSTKAFADCGLLWRPEIWINLKGREPEGTVEPGEEYEELRDKLIKIFSSLTDPETGEKVVARVDRREDIYHGPYLEKAADLLITWRFDFPISGLCYEYKEERIVLNDSTIGKSHSIVTGTHRPNGIFIARGMPLRKDFRVQKAKITDIAPTILYLMGKPIPEDMDGSVLKAAFTEDYLLNNPIKYESARGEKPRKKDQQKYSEEEEEMVKKRLKGLGYLE
jgi:predicted AlkP superfamily phosphohydrolase/phosphomutase